MAAHILMVEDDEDIADFVAYNLQRQGWKTTLVHDGIAGLEQIRTQVEEQGKRNRDLYRIVGLSGGAFLVILLL